MISTHLRPSSEHSLRHLSVLVLHHQRWKKIANLDPNNVSINLILQTHQIIAIEQPGDGFTMLIHFGGVLKYYIESHGPPPPKRSAETLVL